MVSGELGILHFFDEEDEEESAIRWLVSRSIAQAVVSAGQNLSEFPEEGFSYLHVALNCNNPSTLISVLHFYEINYEIKDNDGLRPISFAKTAAGNSISDDASLN